jgi:hypothetical protein
MSLSPVHNNLIDMDSRLVAYYLLTVSGWYFHPHTSGVCCKLTNSEVHKVYYSMNMSTLLDQVDFEHFLYILIKIPPGHRMSRTLIRTITIDIEQVCQR